MSQGHVSLRHVPVLINSVLPMQQADKFKTLGITPPKGCLMYGPPGTCSSSIADLFPPNNQERVKLCLLEHVLPKPKPATSNSLVHLLFK